MLTDHSRADAIRQRPRIQRDRAPSPPCQPSDGAARRSCRCGEPQIIDRVPQQRLRDVRRLRRGQRAAPNSMSLGKYSCRAAAAFTGNARRRQRRCAAGKEQSGRVEPGQWVRRRSQCRCGAGYPTIAGSLAATASGLATPVYLSTAIDSAGTDTRRTSALSGIGGCPTCISAA